MLRFKRLVCALTSVFSLIFLSLFLGFQPNERSCIALYAHECFVFHFTSFIEIVVPNRCRSLLFDMCVYSIFVMNTHTKTVVFVCHVHIRLTPWNVYTKRPNKQQTNSTANALYSFLVFNLISIWNCSKNHLSHKTKLGGIDAAIFILFSRLLDRLLWYRWNVPCVCCSFIGNL